MDGYICNSEQITVRISILRTLGGVFLKILNRVTFLLHKGTIFQYSDNMLQSGDHIFQKEYVKSAMFIF